jgi:hypothetical protein
MAWRSEYGQARMINYQCMSRKKKSLTLEEFARMGGYASARAQTKEARSERARKAVNARWAKRKAKNAAA